MGMIATSAKLRALTEIVEDTPKAREWAETLGKEHSPETIAGARAYLEDIAPALARLVLTLSEVVEHVGTCADWESEDVATLNVTELKVWLARGKAALAAVEEL